MENTFLGSIKNIKSSESSLPEQVSEQIRQLIIEQHMEIGEKLPNEFELAQQLNVGRGTVREAVKILVARNVLEIRRGKGTYIAHNTGMVDDPFGFAYLEDEERLARELFDIRMRLEPWAAGLAAEHATEEKIEELCSLQKEVENAIREGKNYLPMDQKFHICIADCTDNRVLPMLIPVITYSVHLFGVMNSQKQAEETIETHAKIVEAIAARDLEGAQKAMEAHLLLNLQTVPALSNEKWK